MDKPKISQIHMSEIKVTRPLVACGEQLAAIGHAIRRQTCRVIGRTSTGSISSTPCSAACPVIVCPPRPAVGSPTRVVAIGTPCLVGLPTYTTVQAAVDASVSGDVIAICPGTYIEQVAIATNNLTLISTTPHAAIIQAPPILVGNAAIIEIDGAQGVNIFDLTIQGPGAPGQVLNYGIYVIGGGSADIDNNIIQSIRDSPLSSGQHGIGIRVGRQASGEVGSVIITRNLIADYQKAGIVVDNLGSGAYIGCNNIRGLGPTPVLANNGIQVSRGALATVEGNNIQGNRYTGNPANGLAAGILLFQIVAPGVIVRGNLITVSNLGIALSSTAGLNNVGALITCNTVINSGTYGIWTDPFSNSNTFSSNTVAASGLFDLIDETVGNSSCCTANSWLCNRATTDNRGGCLVASTSTAKPTSCAALRSAVPVEVVED